MFSFTFPQTSFHVENYIFRNSSENAINNDNKGAYFGCINIDKNIEKGEYQGLSVVIFPSNEKTMKTMSIIG